MEVSKQVVPSEALEQVVLLEGGHRRREDGMCLMEAVAYFAGLTHSDAPECTSRVLAAFARRLNDRVTADERARLKVLIPILIGTNESQLEAARLRVLVLGVAREIVPLALEAAKVKGDHAEKLRALKDDASFEEIRAVCLEAQSDAAAYAAAYADAADAAAAAAYAYAYAAAYAAAAYAYAYAAAVANAPHRRRVVDAAIGLLRRAAELKSSPEVCA